MWRSSSCQVQGRGHIYKNIPCQDKTKMIFENDTNVIALADGAGFARLSHYGAACVVDSMTRLFANSFDEMFLEDDVKKVKLQIMEKLMSQLESKAKELDCRIEDLASTMLMVAVKNDRFIMGHIGDGVIGYLDGKTLKVASSPNNGEFANETFFVTSNNAIGKMKIFKGEINEIAGFILMSDGTENSLYNKQRKSLSPAIIKLLKRNTILNEEAMCEKLEDTFKNVISTRTFDDCSIALLSRKNDILRSIDELSMMEKCDLYGIARCDVRGVKRVIRYELILELLQKPFTCNAISRKIYLKPQYTRRYLENLCAVGLVRCKNGLFCRFSNNYLAEK